MAAKEKDPRSRTQAQAIYPPPWLPNTTKSSLIPSRAAAIGTASQATAYWRRGSRSRA